MATALSFYHYASCFTSNRVTLILAFYVNFDSLMLLAKWFGIGLARLIRRKLLC